MSVHIFSDAQQLMANTAMFCVESATLAIAEHEIFNFVLAGGSTPQGVYALLANPPYTNQIQWEKVQIFFGDERCVPLDHPDSNFNMANQTLLSKVPITAEHIFPMVVDESTLIQSAQKYVEQLQKNVPLDPNGMPQFDLILLGMGKDGHTASLFPHTSIIEENTKLVASVYVEKMSTWRMSLTFPVINHAKHILILVSGEDKAQIIREVLMDSNLDDPYPIQQLAPDFELSWFIDQPAASLLPQKWITNNAKVYTQ